MELKILLQLLHAVTFLNKGKVQFKNMYHVTNLMIKNCSRANLWDLTRIACCS